MFVRNLLDSVEKHRFYLNYTFDIMVLSLLKSREFFRKLTDKTTEMLKDANHLYLSDELCIVGGNLSWFLSCPEE